MPTALATRPPFTDLVAGTLMGVDNDTTEMVDYFDFPESMSDTPVHVISLPLPARDDDSRWLVVGMHAHRRRADRVSYADRVLRSRSKFITDDHRSRARGILLGIGDPVWAKDCVTVGHRAKCTCGRSLLLVARMQFRGMSRLGFGLDWVHVSDDPLVDGSTCCDPIDANSPVATPTDDAL